MTVTQPSFCRLCSASCPIEVTVEDGLATTVRGDFAAPLYRGYICPKGRILPDMHASPDRLLHSLKRQADGSYKPIPVDQAIGEIAEKLAPIIAAYGPRAFALYLGGGAQPHPATAPVALSFLAATGSPLAFSSTCIDQPGVMIADALHGQWLGGRTPLSQADVFLMAGGNPVISKQYFSQNPGMQLKDAVARGTQLIVIDPRKTETARRAALHLQARPGEDATIFAGLIHLLIEMNLVNEAFVRENVTGLDILADATRPFTPDYVARRAEVPQEDLVRAARMLGAARKGGIGGGTGVAMSSCGGNLPFYLGLCLQSLRGFWAEAGDPYAKPNVLLPAGPPPKAQPSPPYPAWGSDDIMRIRGVKNSVAGIPTGVLADEILTPGDGKIRALFLLGGVMSSFPDQQRIHRALADLELLVVSDIEFSNTARMADYVIGAKMSLETPGTTGWVESFKFIHPGYGWDEPFAQYSPAIVNPPPGAELIEDWQFYYRVARQMGLQLELPDPLAPESGAYALDMANEPTTDALYEILWRNARIPLDEVKRHPHGHVFDEARLTVAPRDPGCDAKLDVGNAYMMAELAKVRAAGDRVGGTPAVDDYPFLLIPRRTNNAWNGSGVFGRKLLKSSVNPAYMNPRDMESLAIDRGDIVELRTRHGAIRTIAETDDSLRAGVIAITHGYGVNPDEPEDLMMAGTCVNRLLVADEEFDPITGMPRMGAVPIAVRRCNEAA